MDLVALSLLDALLITAWALVQDKITKQIPWDEDLEVRDGQLVGKGRKENKRERPEAGGRGAGDRDRKDGGKGRREEEERKDGGMSV